MKQHILFVCASMILLASLPLASIAAEDLSVVKPYKGSLTPVTIDTSSLGEMEKYVVATYEDDNGDILVNVVIPDLPPEQRISGPVIENLPLGSKILTAPAFNWTYGCAATSAGMLCGYYDRNGFPNLYVGSVNGGVCPINNSPWGSAVGAGSSGECPMVATRQGLEGRTSKGHVDDYWINVNSTGDPYYNHWSPHNSVGSGDCLADFMGTSQWYPGNLQNKDGSTGYTFYYNGNPYSSTSFGDLAYGVKKYIEYKGYNVSSYYNQLIYSAGGYGCTFQDYKNEIDAGKPVFIHVRGHTMLGVGYNDTSSTIYLHDTWDYSRHSMTWGGSYSEMGHWAMTVIRIGGSPLTPPTNLSASDGTYSDRIYISWSGVSGATHYRIARATSSSGSGVEYSSFQTGTTFNDYSATPGVTYYYWVQAAGSSSGSGASSFSSYNSGYRGSSAVPAPSWVTASDGTYSDGVHLSWAYVSGATHYRVARSTSSSGTGAIYSTWYGGGRSIVDTSAIAGTYYYYWVQAARSSSGSGAGACRGDRGYRGSSAVSAPSWVTASDGTHSDGVHVGWAYVSGATHYRIARSTNSSGAGYILSTWYGGGRNFVDTSTRAGIYYYYWVQAARSSSGSGAGAFSSCNRGHRASTALSAPSWISASDGAYSDGVHVSWASVSGATYYRIARSTSSSGAGYTLSNWYGGGRNFVDTSTTAGTYYYYWVQAARSSSGSGAGAFSSYNRGHRASASSDPYEPSNTSVQFNLTPYNGKWLTQIRGVASISSTSDVDYYKVYLPAGRYDFTLLLNFEDSSGDLDLYLYGGTGTLLASSRSTSDNESITGVLNVPSSAYIYFGVNLYGSAPRYPVYYNLGYLATTARASSSGETPTGSECTFVSDVAPEENSK